MDRSRTQNRNTKIWYQQITHLKNIARDITAMIKPEEMSAL